jgi:hypothetical protein
MHFIAHAWLTRGSASLGFQHQNFTWLASPVVTHTTSAQYALQTSAGAQQTPWICSGGPTWAGASARSDGFSPWRHKREMRREMVARGAKALGL